MKMKPTALEVDAETGAARYVQTTNSNPNIVSFAHIYKRSMLEATETFFVPEVSSPVSPASIVAW